VVAGGSLHRPANRPLGPAGTRPPADPAALQKQLDRVVEAGTPGVVGLVRTGERTWQGASGLGDLRATGPPEPVTGSGSAA